MKINWKLRLQNKTALLAIIGAGLAFIYQVLGLFGVVPGISQDVIMEVVGLGVNLLVMVGVVIDPTTQGVSDSEKALNYEKLK